MLKEVVVYHHLGLGDHFICNGLINKLSEIYKIHLICKKNNFDTVQCLYSDNSNIIVIPIIDELKNILLYCKDNKLELIQIGFRDFNNKTFDQSFYSQFGYDLSLRYDNFRLPKYIKNSKKIFEQLCSSKEYALISNMSSEGQYDINISTELNKIYIVPGITTNLLDYIDLIFNAKEIHCIDSSVYHLVDSLSLNAKLYFYDVRNSDGNKIRVSEKWKII